MTIKQTPANYCDRCSHGPWLPRKGKSKICPKCKSKHWNNGPRADLNAVVFHTLRRQASIEAAMLRYRIRIEDLECLVVPEPPTTPTQGD